MDTGTFTQQEEKFCTNDVKTANKQPKGYRFTEPKVSFSEKEYTVEEVESEAPEMTKKQWAEYYKKMGLE